MLNLKLECKQNKTMCGSHTLSHGMSTAFVIDDGTIMFQISAHWSLTSYTEYNYSLNQLIELVMQRVLTIKS